MYQLEGAVEVVPEPTSYRVEGSGDRLLFDGPGDMPELSLVRCGDGTDDGTGSSSGME